MDAETIAYLSAEELAAAYRTGGLSPLEVTRALLDRIDRLNPTLNAFLHIAREPALAAAAASHEAIQLGHDRGPLEGVPVTIKDLFDVRGLPTTAGSKLNVGVIAQHDVILVERLRAAGAVILGKTNTPEFGLLPITENDLGEPCRNPWDLTRTSGGSSGGAAAAAAAGLGPLHVGTDGAGSIRIPAAFCGVFGLKPTYGRIPRAGVSGMPLFSHAGPLTRTVADAALLLDATAGPDPRDPRSLPAPPPRFHAALNEPLGRPRLAVWRPSWDSPCDKELVAAVTQAAAVFERLGCQVEEAAPHTDDWRPIYMPLMLGDEYTASGHLYEQRAADLTLAARATFRDGAAITVPVYSRALRGREQFQADMRSFFETYELLLLPSTATLPYVTKQPTLTGGLHETLTDFPYTPPFNLTGQPAAALPTGLSAAGLPLAVQLVGRFGEDTTVLRACHAFLEAQPFDRRPRLTIAD